MAIDYLIPADLRTSMDELAAHIAAGRFEARLSDLTGGGPAPAPQSIGARIRAAICPPTGGPPRRFADDAAGIAARLDALDAVARAVAIFVLLPCAGDCGPRADTESDFAFVVRLFGSRALVWRIASGDSLAQLPGLAPTVLDVTVDPLRRARQYLDTVPRAAAWLGWFAAAGDHPDTVPQRATLAAALARWLVRHRHDNSAVDAPRREDRAW